MASAVNELSLTPENAQSFVQQFFLLQRGHNELVEAYNKNNVAYRQVLQHLDARIGMIMMAQDDQVRGELKVIEADGKKSVNWPVYFEEYKAIVQADEIKRQKAVEEKTNGNGESPLVTPEPPPAEETVVEFGGT